MSAETTSHLSLAAARTIVDEALSVGRRHEMQPLTVVVLDRGGHVVCCQREDGAGILRFEIAFGKAWGALGMGRPSRDLEQVSLQRPVFITSLAAVSGGRLVPVAGGVLIVAEGAIVGGVGISGDTSDADELCAIEGIRAAGFASIPAEPPRKPA